MPRQRKIRFGTRELAAHLNMKDREKQVRRILRSIPKYNDGIYTKYGFTEDELPKIVAAIRSRAKRKTPRDKVVVTSKGQLVIPAAIRKRYRIKKGTKVHIQEVEGGILLRPITEQSIKKARGILEGKGLPDHIEKEPDRDIR